MYVKFWYMLSTRSGPLGLRNLGLCIHPFNPLSPPLLGDLKMAGNHERWTDDWLERPEYKKDSGP
jgi:hypothetical protein